MLGPLDWIEIVFLFVVLVAAAGWLIMRAYSLRNQPGGRRLLVGAMFVGAGILMSVAMSLLLASLIVAFTDPNLFAEIASSSLQVKLLLLGGMLVVGLILAEGMWIGMSDRTLSSRR